MNHSLVAFTPSSDIPLTSYVSDQLLAIQNQFPALTIEHVNETDARLAMYARRPDRFPCFIIFKNGIRKASKNAKVDHTTLAVWVSQNIN